MTPEQLAARLARITNWWQDDLRAPSRAALVSEYLRRAALWARALDCPELWAWFDVAHEIDPAVRADAALVEQVNEGISKGGGSPFEKRMAEYALHFAALPDVPHDLPDPYEPLIAAWERGGSLRRENGLVYVGGTMGVPVRTLADNYSPVPVASAEPLAMATADELWAAHPGSLGRWPESARNLLTAAGWFGPPRRPGTGRIQ
ncbi:hypothetical protein CS0771_73380 [Catellatospora sp. IY07-71]|uniref:hypothetical protein n=1 Tax=Catellatospora sp. IY07-71 TaxID=2728827 RepID=UPI001BB2F0EB|nr:hypothetical protein [Catellatospora sp. IY07-71]BCJ77794.1 hypothetical protein CS0771_73380 [Catellatospora sp. IY07-71]